MRPGHISHTAPHEASAPVLASRILSSARNPPLDPFWFVRKRFQGAAYKLALSKDSGSAQLTVRKNLKRWIPTLTRCMKSMLRHEAGLADTFLSNLERVIVNVGRIWSKYGRFWSHIGRKW